VNITKVVLEADSSSIKAATKDLNALQGSGEKAEKSVTGLGTAAKVAGTILASLAASFSVREVIQYADEWTNASNRLRLVTASSSELANVQQTLLRVANETRAGFSGTAELFTVLTRSTRDLGLSQSEIVSITKTLNQSFAVSGAAAGAMDGAIRQLSQGLQSGALRGDEFNSVAEQAPGILDAVAFSLNMGRGELREFAATGGITSAVLVKAIHDYADVINNEFSKAQRTFGQSLQEARNNTLAFVGGSEQVQAATRLAGDAIVLMSNNLDVLASAAAVVATVIAARMVVSVGASSAAFIVSTQQAIAYQLALARMAGVSATAAASQAALSGALALVGGPAGALLLVVGGLALMISRMESAREMTARLRKELDSLSREELTRGIQVQKAYIQGIETQIARLQKQNQSVAAVRERMAELSIRLEEGQKDLQRLENAMRGVEDREFDKLIDDMTEGFHGYTAAAKPAIAVTNDLSRALETFVHSMDSAAAASYNTESAYVQLMGITDQVTVRTTRLTAEQRAASLTNISAQDSIDGIVEKMGKQSKASEELTQVTAQMRNDISSAFADMMMNGENAFDAIAKSFERMIYKMLADWAAAGIMNLVSKAFGGVGGHTSTLGNIISGAGTSSIGSAVGSIIGGGSAAAAGAAVGGTAGVSTVFAAGAPTAAGLTSSAIGTTAATTSAGSSGFLAAAAAPVAVFAAIAGGLMIGAKQNEKQREELKQEWLAAEASLAGMGINVNEIYSESAVRNMLEAAPEFAGLPGVDAAALSQGLISGAVRQFLFDPSSYQQMDGSNANGLDYVPFDGYRSTLHQGEAVITARGNDALGMMASALTEMRTIMAAVAQHTAKSARQLERWDFGGLPEERAFA